MIYYAYTSDDKPVSLNDVEKSQRLTYESFQKTINDNIGNIHCPNHPKDGRVTIFINLSDISYDFNIVSMCCPDYTNLIKTNFPSQFKQAIR